MPRRTEALHVEDCGDHLTVTAELADGAQLGRRDMFVFKRQTSLRRKQDGTHYRIAVSVRDIFDSPDLLSVIRSARLNGVLDGFGISVEDGILRAVVPIIPEATKHWTRARQGDTAYRVVHFTLPKYRRLGSDSDSMTPVVEICVSRWVPKAAAELPAWVLRVP
jgi:hypothetical protein